MSIFAFRRRDAISALKVPEALFQPIEDGESVPSVLREPEQLTAVSAANELVTALVALDIVEAVRADNPLPERAEMPAPLSQRHLETIDRMVAHLKGDEERLHKHIADAKRQLADTKLARHVFERNSADLRRGIALLSRPANSKPSASQQLRSSRVSSARALQTREEVDGAGNVEHRRLSKQLGPRDVH